MSDTTLFEHAYYIGNIMGAILYGFELSIYFMIMRGLFHHSTKIAPRRRQFCASYSTAMILLSTIDVACNAVWGESMWITDRNVPGGVPAFIMAKVYIWYETLGSTSVVASVFLGDALLLFRLYLIYGRRHIIVAFPILAYLVALALAIQQVVISGEPNGDFFGLKTIRIAVAYYAITIFLNILVTVLICLRLLRVSKIIYGALGAENAKVYTSTVAILVESAAPYSVLGIMFLIPYALQSGIAILFGQLWSKMSGIAPQLIILRVVNGSAWHDEMNTRAETALAFATTTTDTQPPAVALPDNSHPSHFALEELPAARSKQ
ncbi:unnamed protein product [Cyclocybe aegerita]|uniref:Uncharacterized protein n=1 Tax=Cyclocybe aegerita TaxID=1973307 RepID=A0A8S0WT98_CYCAE|nr:unnamed protein product [Cyclocybe aegerita]